jgi:hypothetical protein
MPKQGPLWEGVAECDSNGCFSIQAPYTGDHRIKAFIDFGDEDNTNAWTSKWVFVVVHREKFTTVTLNIEKVKN